MAQGYEVRGAARSSFLLDDAAPVQTTRGSSGQSRGASLVGGQATGGVVTAGMETNPGNVAAGLGQYFEQLMAPQVERAKMARFFEGYTRAQAGEELADLTNNDNPLNKIFGPSGFEQGAQFYTAQARIDKWATERLAEEDTLKRMPPEELGKVMADTSQKMLTGDPYADAIIQKGLLEAQGPIIKQIAGARFKWQQEEAVSAMSQAGDAGATALQQLAYKQAQLKPEERDSAATTQQVQRFLGSMMKPEGMTDDSYKKFLKDFMGNQMRNKNFYAVELMREAGIDRVLDDAERTAVDNAYERFGNKALEDAASDPDILERLMKLDAGIETEQLSGGQVVDELRSINQLLSDRTGVAMDYFDRADMQGGAKRVIDVIVARQRRLEARAWQLEDRQYARETALSVEEMKDEREAKDAQYAWAGGGVNSAITAGVDESNFHVLATSDWQQGNISNIIQAFRKEGWHSPRLAETIQAGVAATLGEEYTKSTEQSYRQWQTLMQASPAAAATYFGKLHLPMQNFNRLVTSGKVRPEEAYRQAFANAGQYADQAVPAARRREVEQQVGNVVGGAETWMPSFLGGRAGLTDSSKEALKNAVTNYVAVAGTHSDRSTKEIMAEAVEAMTANGTIERYGSILWRNPKPTQPIGRLLGLQQGKADDIVSNVIDTRLKKAGFPDGASGSLTIIRTGSPKAPTLTITARKDGRPTWITIPFSDLQAAAQADVNKRPTTKGLGDDTGFKGPIFTTSNPKRKPGETTWQKVVRQNKENANK